MDLLTEKDALSLLENRAKKYYVYILINSFTKEPFYVGYSGETFRPFSHQTDTSNKLKRAYISKLRRKNISVIYSIWDFYDSLIESLEVEKYFIRTFGRKNLDRGGILVNRTLGQPFVNDNYSLEDIKNFTKDIHDGDLKILSKVYKGMNEFIQVGCNICGYRFDKTPNNLLHRKQGCIVCHPNGSSKLTPDIVSYQFNLVHNNYYDYSLFTVYYNYYQIINIICPKHGIFKQNIGEHKSGAGCTLCGKDSVKEKLSLGINVFLERLEARFPKKFNTSGVVYVNVHTKVDLGCKDCGSQISTTPYVVLNSKYGCKRCSSLATWEKRRNNG